MTERAYGGWVRAAALVVVLALAACGGGGGEGGGGSAADPATAVRVALTSPTQPYNATVPSESRAPDLTLVGRATGDLATLNGRTLLLVVEDPSGLFETGPFASVNNTTGEATVALRGKVLTAAGHHAGNLRVLVCLDAACQSQLQGSPLILPYDVTVLPGLTVAADTVELTSRYGDGPTQRTLAVTLPPQVDQAQVVSSAFVGGPVSYFFSATAATTAPGSAVVTLDFPMMVPGSYTGFLFVSAGNYTRTVTVRHTVADNAAVAAAVWPRSFAFTQRAGDRTQRPVRFDILARPGDSLQYLGVTYLEAPPAAAGHAQHNAWWYVSVVLNEPTMIPCDTAGGTDCLPAGTYRAAARWLVIRADGSQATAEFPIAMTLTP